MAHWPLLHKKHILLLWPLRSPRSHWLLLARVSSLPQYPLDSWSTLADANIHSMDTWSVSRQCWQVLPFPFWLARKFTTALISQLWGCWQLADEILCCMSASHSLCNDWLHKAMLSGKWAAVFWVHNGCVNAKALNPTQNVWNFSTILRVLCSVGTGTTLLASPPVCFNIVTQQLCHVDKVTPLYLSHTFTGIGSSPSLRRNGVTHFAPPTNPAISWLHPLAHPLWTLSPDQQVQTRNLAFSGRISMRHTVCKCLPEEMAYIEARIYNHMTVDLVCHTLPHVISKYYQRTNRTANLHGPSRLHS